VADGIPAYVVSADDFTALLAEEFRGDMPNRINDLDDYIMINGTPYAERCDNGHEHD
jgi:hypothetical protein